MKPATSRTVPIRHMTTLARPPCKGASPQTPALGAPGPRSAEFYWSMHLRSGCLKGGPLGLVFSRRSATCGRQSGGRRREINRTHSLGLACPHQQCHADRDEDWRDVLRGGEAQDSSIDEGKIGGAQEVEEESRDGVADGENAHQRPLWRPAPGEKIEKGGQGR